MLWHTPPRVDPRAFPCAGHGPLAQRCRAPRVVIIALGLPFRIWALAGSWYFFDDLAFLSAGTNDPLSWHFVGRVYAGHVMPAGWLVVKLLATWAPYQWGVWAGVLVVMQAVASFGMLRLLRSMFGDTRVVPALLAGYVFYVFTVPAGIWFAAGINQLPFQIALVFGLHAHLDYLRTRRTEPWSPPLRGRSSGCSSTRRRSCCSGCTGCWRSAGSAAANSASGSSSCGRATAPA